MTFGDGQLSLHFALFKLWCENRTLPLSERSFLSERENASCRLSKLSHLLEVSLQAIK